MRPEQPEKLIDPETGESYTETLSSNFEVKTIEYRNKGGQLHREGDRPAKIVYKRTPEGEFYKSIEAWFVNALRHRENGPAWIRYWTNGNSIEEEWWLNDTKTRLDKSQPTEIQYFETGEISAKIWAYPEFSKGNFHGHRIGGPASIYYTENGKIHKEYWWEFGKIHRKGAPCSIEYDDEGYGIVVDSEWIDRTKEKDLIKTPLYNNEVLRKGVNLLGQIGFQKIGHHWSLLNAALGEITLK
jgi:hypothetical protein